MADEDKAAAAARLESRWRAEGRLFGQVQVRDGAAQRAHLFGRRTPPVWSFWWVGERLAEAFVTLSRIPVQTRPKGFGSAWPSYRHDRGDLNCQIESGAYELNLRARNRLRPQASPAEIERMTEAFLWPAHYLGAAPEVARAVLQGADWAARRLDEATMCGERGINAIWFGRRRVHGLRVIATGLVRDGVRVS